MDLCSDFFVLLRDALHPGKEALELHNPDWGSIYRTACRHCVQGIMFDAVQRLPAGSGITPTLAAMWLRDAMKIESEYECIKALVAEQSAVWKELGIDAVLLKGLNSAKYYPVPSHRVSGDIDWWMRSGKDWNMALDWLRREQIAWQKDSDGDISYEKGGIIVEHHRKGLVADGPEAELLFLAGHLFHHAAVSGIGLRHFCDYAMALDWYEGKYDRKLLASMASARGLSAWLHLLDSTVYVFMTGVPAGKREDALLSLLMDDGNFGLEGGHRFRSFFRRAGVVGTVAPGQFAKRWLSLAIGRMKRIL